MCWWWEVVVSVRVLPSYPPQTHQQFSSLCCCSVLCAGDPLMLFCVILVLVLSSTSLTMANSHVYPSCVHHEIVKDQDIHIQFEGNNVLLTFVHSMSSANAVLIIVGGWTSQILPTASYFFSFDELQIWQGNVGTWTLHKVYTIKTLKYFNLFM